MKRLILIYTLITTLILVIAVACYFTFKTPQPAVPSSDQSTTPLAPPMSVSTSTHPQLANTVFDQLEQIRQRGQLRVSTLDLAPFYRIDAAGVNGIDYELAKKFADYLGVKLVMVPKKNIIELFDDLENDRADMIAAALIYNPERMDKFRTGPAYYSTSQQIVYRKGSTRPNSLKSLNKPLNVVEGAAHIATLRYLQQTKYPHLQWQAVHNQSTRELLRQVADGTLPYAIADSLTVSAFQRIYPQLSVAFDVTDEEPIMWYLKKSNDDSFYAAMLDFFHHIREGSTLAKLEEKYLSHTENFDYFDAKAFVTAIKATLPVLQPIFIKYQTKSVDWHLLAAVSYQESHWDPLATSSTGVRGLMMLTRPTAEIFHVKDRLDPEQSIRGGSQYLVSLLQRISTKIPEDEKIWFALAAYNMGFAHMEDARKLTKMQGGDMNSWADVKKRLPMLTQPRYYTQVKYGYARGYQAYHYVENIRRYRVTLDDYLQEKAAQQKNQSNASTMPTRFVRTATIGTPNSLFQPENRLTALLKHGQPMTEQALTLGSAPISALH